MAEHVEVRDADPLLPIMSSVIERGITIWTDCWNAYNGLEKQGYAHGTANHSENFVDPETAVHTQMIESNWAVPKALLRKRHCRSREHLMEHIHEWCYRRNLGATFSESWQLINSAMNA